jgi:hypothetical protein
MKKTLFLVIILITSQKLIAQTPDFQRFAYRVEPQKAIVLAVKMNPEAKIEEVYYQSWKDAKKVKLILGETWQDPENQQTWRKAQHPQTKEKFDLSESWAMGGNLKMKGQDYYFHSEDMYTFQTERLYINMPPMVSQVWYSNATSPIPLPIKNCNCEQTADTATWLCTGNMPNSGSSVTIKYEADKRKITFTSPKGTKVYQKIE